MARLWRAFHDAPGLAPGARVELDRDEAHHVRRVLRLAVGERIAVFDGRGGEWEALLVASSGSAVTVELSVARGDAVEPSVALTLYQGRARPERFEWVVQKATELGVSAVIALECERSEGRPPDARRLERWRRVAIEACKQSGRRCVPDVGTAQDLPTIEPGAAPGWILDTSAGAPGLGERLGGSPGPAAALAVGPEGGFSPAEVRRALDSGWLPAGLGPRILRTETAGVVGAALVLHRWADLGAG